MKFSKILAVSSILYTALANSLFFDNVESKIAENSETVGAHPADFDKTFQQIVEENGLTYSTYPVVTEDGYKLTVFRVKASTTQSGAPVVFFQHGMMDSADAWVMNWPEKAPAIVAAKAGYDVWLGNQRGNKYSIDKDAIAQDKKKYWDFSYTEMGKYDAPAQIEQALKVSGRDTVTWVGHEQGNTQMFFALQNDQEYWNKKINLFIAAGPVTRMDHATSDLILTFAQEENLLQSVFHLFGAYSVFGGKFQDAAVKKVCGIVPILCRELESQFNTDDPELDDLDRAEVYLAHLFSAASIKSLVHYGQSAYDHTFCAYNYGSDKANIDKYGVPEPPMWIMEKLNKVPTAMFVGLEDQLGDPVDNEWVQQSMNDGGKALIHYEEMHAGHNSFIVGKNMTYWTDRSMSLIAKYNPLKFAAEE